MQPQHLLSKSMVMLLKRCKEKVQTGSGEFWIDEVELIGRSFSPSSTNRVELTELLITANTLYEKATTTVYVQQTIDEFAIAINNAADVNASLTSTPEDITEAVASLQEAINIFKTTKDHITLTNLISSATKTIVSATTDLYPQEAIDELANAIKNATKANENATTREDIDNAVLALQNAIDTFNAAKIPTSIALIDTNITLYPNPCTDRLNIQSSESIKMVKIYNQNGQTMTTNIVNNSIDVSQLRKGCYVVSITLASGETITEQFNKL